MGVRQEVHHAVLVRDGYTFIVGFKSRMELTVSQDDTLRVAGSTTGVQDVGNVVVGSFLLQLLHLGLARQILA